MGLRNRLWLVVGALVLTPLLAGGLASSVLLKGALEQRVRGTLDADAAAVSVLLSQRCREAAIVGRSLGAEAALSDPASATRAMVAAADYADYAALLDADGRVIAEAGAAPAPARGLRSCSAEPPSGPLIAERVPLELPGAGAPHTAVVASRIDSGVLDGIRARLGFDGVLTLLGDDGVPLATSGSPERAAAMAAAARESAAAADGWLVEDDPAVTDRPFWVVAAAPAPDLSWIAGLVTGVLLLVAAVTLAAGWQLSRQLTGPLAEVTAAAERVAAGDLDTTLPVRRHDEVGRLALAFNHMTRELRRNLSALSHSRHAVQDSLARLGGALGSTHDLAGLLQVVLHTAVLTAGARSGGAWAADGAGPLRLVATEGDAGAGGAPLPDRIDPGRSTGLAQRALATGELAREGRHVAVPLLRGERPVGLLLIEGETEHDGGRPPDTDPDEALRTLASQAGIAVDNVLLHREAQRLSITDPLTGLWNFRYLSMSLAREIERAQRFDRPLAVLMLDLDHFKRVNDTHGHARGDAVLREVAARLGEQIREVDTLARYGGEEFVLVLPETTLDGAAHLAERICAAVRRQPFGDGGPPLHVTLSVGVASFPQHGASAATLMRAADEALYVAKNSGRDRWYAADGPAGG